MIKLKRILEGGGGGGWCAIVLRPESRRELLDKLYFHIPEGWRTYADHMTVDWGGPMGGGGGRLGREYELIATEVGCSERVCAVKVRGYDGEVRSGFPHITLAVDEVGGGESKDSIGIERWERIVHPIRLVGVLKNIRKED